MSAIVRLTQGSPEWHAHRARYRNASETPAVLGVSPWLTPYGLWLQRTGRSEPAVNAAMARGTRLEAAAREAYERLTGHVMEPLVIVEGDYSASLDGMTLDGGLILEIKCPFQGRDSELWRQAQAGELPEHYRWQVEHQLMVTGASMAHLYVFDGAEGLLLERRPNEGTWPKIHEAWDDFMRFVTEDRPPPLGEGDTVIRDDPEWTEAAHAFLAAKQTLDETSARLEQCKSRLVDLAMHSSEKGAGVVVSRYWKAGPVDYKRVPQLAGVDLGPYRGAPREEVRVAMAK